MDLDVVMAMARVLSRALIRVGDDKQLQPTVVTQSRKNCFADHLRFSLFHCLKVLGLPSIFFREQHRMTEQLAALPSRMFYHLVLT